jgi:CubicO group peptidase (beta-lactamase class C family)
MKTYKMILAALMLLVISKATIAQQQSTGMNNSEEIDSLIEGYVENHGFMGSVLVAEKGKIIFSQGYGLADVENNIPNNPETQFGIGSITKQFTAMLITQLAERGKLEFDKPISDYLPEFPKEYGEKITVEMLLNHTSGLRLPEDIEKYYHATRKEEWLQEYLKQNAEEGLRFEPGKGYAYSNGGYFMLGLIIEKVTGKSYEEVLAEQILKPLGMTKTGTDRKELALENRAISYRKLQHGYITWNEEANSYDPAVCGFGYGNMYSTVKDVFKFSQALSTNRLLSNKYMDMYLKMRNIKTRSPLPFISRELLNEFFGSYGNGFAGEISIVDDEDSKEQETFFWHDGTNKLFVSNHYHFTRNDQIIIVCSNCTFRGEGDEMVMKIYQLLNHEPYDHIRIRHSLWQYVAEDIGTHAGEEAAVSEWQRFENDTLNFIVEHGRYHGWFLRKALSENGINGMMKLYNEIKKSNPGELNGDVLNGIGYSLLGSNRIQDAIEVFKLNVDAYPDYANGYDSLGEAYMKNGQTDLAILNYKKSLELDPNNENAKKILEQ